MDKVGIVYHPKYEAARRVADDAASRLAGRVGDVWVASAWDEDARAANIAGTELLICCGGDGTMLQAARAVVPHKVVLLGVNMGRIGFLTELGPTALFEKLDAIVAGEGRIETRSMMETETVRGGEAINGHFHALNDVVIGRAQLGRTVQFSVSCDDTLVGSYRADAVIVATATGSTAYSLSVGGPIMHPQSREIIVTLVAPHLAPANTLVLPEGSLVQVQTAENQPAILSVDGEPDQELAGGDTVRVRASGHEARFLRFGPPGEFFSRVGRRLNWLHE